MANYEGKMYSDRAEINSSFHHSKKHTTNDFNLTVNHKNKIKKEKGAEFSTKDANYKNNTSIENCCNEDILIASPSSCLSNEFRNKKLHRNSERHAENEVQENRNDEREYYNEKKKRGKNCSHSIQELKNNISNDDNENNNNCNTNACSSHSFPPSSPSHSFVSHSPSSPSFSISHKNRNENLCKSVKINDDGNVNKEEKKDETFAHSSEGTREKLSLVQEKNYGSRYDIKTKKVINNENQEKKKENTEKNDENDNKENINENIRRKSVKRSYERNRGREEKNNHRFERRKYNECAPSKNRRLRTGKNGGSPVASTSSSDYEEQVRRSRSRERNRIRTQYATIQKYCKTNESQVFWDGFQWVNKGEGAPDYDQQMNATRRARRLHMGNLPLFMDVTENDFKEHLWKTMRENNLCISLNTCPILHIWFARDRGGNFGFMEMSTVEDAHNALKLDGLLWNGIPIRINRPTDWKKTVSTHAIDVLASTSNLAVAESLAAAAQQAAITGNSAGLLSLVNQLPQQQQKAIIDLMNQHILPNFQERSTNAALPVDFIREKIKADLLTGTPSRIVRIIKPSSDLQSVEEYDDVLSDIKEECIKYGAIMAALIIVPSIKQKISSVLTDVGDVFFEFATTSQADNCIINMSGRMYDKKPVKMIRFDESIYNQKLKTFSQNLFLKVLEAAQGPP